MRVVRLPVYAALQRVGQARWPWWRWQKQMLCRGGGCCRRGRSLGGDWGRAIDCAYVGGGRVGVAAAGVVLLTTSS